jgi:ferredoxin
MINNTKDKLSKKNTLKIQTTSVYLPYSRLQTLITHLNQKYHCIGPQEKNGTIVYDILENVEQLPWDKKDKQAPGHYQLETTTFHQAFGWANGQQAIKPHLFKPYEILWEAKRVDGKLTFADRTERVTRPMAFFGVRPCDVAAMAIQDHIFMKDVIVDEYYKSRRDNIVIIAANCTYASDMCFCVSAGGYPQVAEYYDLALTELDAGFVVDIGTEIGANLLAPFNLSPATSTQIESAVQRIQQAADSQTQTLPTANLQEALANSHEHPQWYDVAQRCLACGNCTQVCPTCFCHAETEQFDEKTGKSEHWRVWDSCFTIQHSYLHGGAIRNQTREFYRQWLTHKLGTWWNQFGESGCVGCGRCITWCPVGIDITEEATKICKNFSTDDE